jgi:TPR repeat protein
MKMPRRLFSVFAGCFTLFLIGTAFAVRADEKDDREKQRLEELKRVEAMLNAQIDALIEREKADPNDAKSLYELGVRCMKADKLADYDPFTAIELYRRAAEMGYAEAQYAYGKMYLVSLHEILPRAAAKAEGVKWLQKAADQGHEKAQLALAKCYSSGEGVKKDEAKAFEVYRKAADAGSAEALYELHVFYLRGWGVEKDEAKAMEVLRKSAEAGYVKAQCSLGFKYQSGSSTPIDLPEAVKWYRLAEAQGDSTAKMYLEQLKDVIPLLEPAEKGDAEAQFKLYKCIVENRNIGSSNLGSTGKWVELEKWLHRSAENGHVPAQLELAEAYLHGFSPVKKELAEAAKWYRKAAEQGSPKAHGMLGCLYATGRGVPRDRKTAVEWFRKGAALNNAESQYGMGVSIEEGWLEPYDEEKDWKTVVDWYIKAADNGMIYVDALKPDVRGDDASLRSRIGAIYYNGFFITDNAQYFDECVKWYRKAAEADPEDPGFGIKSLRIFASRQSFFTGGREAAKQALRELAKNGNEAAQDVIDDEGWGEPEEETGEKD